MIYCLIRNMALQWSPSFVVWAALFRKEIYWIQA